jgi:hypothetical protein
MTARESRLRILVVRQSLPSKPNSPWGGRRRRETLERHRQGGKPAHIKLSGELTVTDVEHRRVVAVANEIVNAMLISMPITRFKNGISVMKLETWTQQGVAAIEREDRDLVQEDAPLNRDVETDGEIGHLIQKVGASSIAKIDGLMGKLQGVKDFLQSEGERIERETARYTNLSQTASASVRIMFETVREWREEGHPLRNQSRASAIEIMPAQADDELGETHVQDEQSPSSSGQA